MQLTLNKIIKYAIILGICLVFAVNGLFLYFSHVTFSGMVTEDAYNKGLSYNKVITAEHAQSTELQADIIYDPAAQSLSFTPSKACDKINVQFISTTRQSRDFALNMPYQSDNYILNLDDTAKGPWLTKINCYIGDTGYYFSQKVDIN